MNGRSCTERNGRNMLVKRNNEKFLGASRGTLKREGIVGYTHTDAKMVVKIDLWPDNLAQNGEIMQADVFLNISQDFIA